MIAQVNLEMELDHFDNPFISISFLNVGIMIGVDTKSEKYKKAHREAQTCLSILNKIIRDNEKGDKK